MLLFAIMNNEFVIFDKMLLLFKNTPSSLLLIINRITENSFIARVSRLKNIQIGMKKLRFNIKINFCYYILLVESSIFLLVFII